MPTAPPQVSRRAAVYVTLAPSLPELAWPWPLPPGVMLALIKAPNQSAPNAIMKSRLPSLGPRKRLCCGGPHGYHNTPGVAPMSRARLRRLRDCRQATGYRMVVSAWRRWD